MMISVPSTLWMVRINADMWSDACFQKASSERWASWKVKARPAPVLTGPATMTVTPESLSNTRFPEALTLVVGGSGSFS